MDRDGSGVIDYDDIANFYNAAQHPDVLAKKKTQREILLEFLDTFEVGGEKDGQVCFLVAFTVYSSVVRVTCRCDDLLGYLLCFV